jgi:voltage-gated potassium channel
MLGRFVQRFLHMSWHVRSIYLGLLALIVAGAAGIAWVEKMPIGDAFYFAFVSGLTIGYGDIVAHTTMGRVISVSLGLVGVLFTGMVVAVAVHALRDAWEEMHPN